MAQEKDLDGLQLAELARQLLPGAPEREDLVKNTQVLGQVNAVEEIVKVVLGS